MNQTDPTLESIITPYTLNQQLRLLIYDRNIEITAMQAMGEMRSRGYLESLRDDDLIATIDEVITSVNDIMATLIMDRASTSGYSTLSIGLQNCLLDDARRYIEQVGIGCEITILRRIVLDVIDILDMRSGSDE